MIPPTCNLPLAMDERMLGSGGTGVATYARALRIAQQRIAPESLLVTGERQGGTALPARLRRVVRAVRPGTSLLTRYGSRFSQPDLFRIAHIRFSVLGELMRVRVPGPPGIMHWSYPVPVIVEGWSNVYTVHDAIPLSHPGLTTIDGERHRRLLSRILASAAQVVTVSKTAREDIIGFLKCDPTRVIDCSQPVMLEDVAPEVLPASLTERGYLLVCGLLEPRKNIERILAAHAIAGAPMPLVFVGPDDGIPAPLRTAIEKAANVVRLPYASRVQIIGLIGQARALLMPSLAEGFGLPVAEAMALGTPVLTSAVGALAETAGDAAFLVDPLNTEAIADGIQRLSSEDELWARLSAAGNTRLQNHFTMDGFVSALGALYARHAPSLS